MTSTEDHTNADVAFSNDDVMTSSNGGDSSDDEMSADDYKHHDQALNVRRLHVRHRSPPKSFPDLVEHCRRHRLCASKAISTWSFSYFTLAHHVMAGRTRLYSLGRIGESAENAILYVDLPDSSDDNHNSMSESYSERTLYWRLLKEPEKDPESTATMSKEEELLRQRLRLLVGGISSYTYHEPTSTFLFSSAGQLYTLVDADCFEHPSLEKVNQTKICEGTPMDAQFCPSNSNLISCVINDDLYLQYGSHLQRLTFSGGGKNKPKSVGVASFIIQEEFERLTGYWWCPVAKNDKFYILYEENDASDVQVLSLNCPAELSDAVELMRYPKPGKPNVRWNIKLLELTLFGSASPSNQVESKILACYHDIRSMFPWAEYMIRAGWTCDGSEVWIQIISRLQRKLAIVSIPLTSFVAENMETSSSNGSMQAPNVVILYEEETPDLLIKHHNYFTIIEQSTALKKFLWCSSKTGFSHLYLVESSPDNAYQSSLDEQCPDYFTRNRYQEMALTSGEWEVCRKAEPHIDNNRRLIFFLGFKDTPIESHIYCLSWDTDGSSSRPIHRLTQPGFCYGATRREPRPFEVSSCGYFMVTTRSSLSSLGQCIVYRLSYPSSTNRREIGESPLSPVQADLLYTLSAGLPEVPIKMNDTCSDVKPEEALAEEEHAPEIITYRGKQSGFTHYACLWRPTNFKRHRLYPTVLSVYAGPEVQLVKNCYLGCMNVSKYTSLGYAVIMIDGRGSANRGLAFEKAIWNQMGTVELDDQVEGLLCISETAKCIDLTRVAIIGWSYGGYAALMGLAKKSDIFKVAVAGAPVTSWEHYDTGYTERFMGLPQPPNDQDATKSHYEASSVLTYVRQLPDQPGRLLLLHGLIDDNVHFVHTSQLIDALLKHAKPYQLQIYPQERHAVRSFDTVLHMEATVLDFLQRNL